MRCRHESCITFLNPSQASCFQYPIACWAVKHEGTADIAGELNGVCLEEDGTNQSSCDSPQISVCSALYDGLEMSPYLGMHLVSPREIIAHL